MSFSHVSHDKIISQMQAMGLKANKGGVCAGLVIMWILFAVKGKEKQYMEFIDRLCQPDFIDKYSKLKDKIANQASDMTAKKERIRAPVNETRKKIANLEKELIDLKKEEKTSNTRINLLREELNKLQSELLILMREREALENDLEIKENYLTTEERNILETFPFLQWVDLGFQASEYEPFLGEYLSQSNLQETFNNMLAESSLQTEQVHSETVIYTEEELKVYFNDLANILKQLEEKTLPMAIDGNTHRIGLRFDTEKDLWILSDPNHLPPVEVKKDEIAAKVMSAVLDTKPNNSGKIFTSFQLWMYSDKNSPTLAATKEAMHKFKAEHIITQEIIERKTEQGATLLEGVKRSGDAETIQKLADQKVDLKNIIFNAARSGFVSVIKVLKQNDLLKEPDYKESVSTAAKYGQIAILKELMDSKIDIINSTDEILKQTPLHIAAINGRTDVIKFLLEQKTLPLHYLHNGDKHGKSPIYLAAENGQIEAIKLLQASGAYFSKYEIGKLAFNAAEKGYDGVIKILIEQGLDLNQHKSTFSKDTLAHVAARYGHLSVIKLLADHKVDLDTRNSSGETPIFIAATKGHAAVVKEIATRSPIDLHQLGGKSGEDTLATAAVKEGRVSVIKTLAELDATLLEQEDKLGNTPASIAMKDINIPCSLIFMPFLFYFQSLPDDAKPAYIITNDRVYYADKSKDHRIEIPIDNVKLAQLKETLGIGEIKLEEKENSRTLIPELRSDQLTNIASITGHGFGAGMIKVLENLKPAVISETTAIISEEDEKVFSLIAAAQAGNITALQPLLELYSPQNLAFYAAEFGYDNIIKQLADDKLIDINATRSEEEDKLSNTLACVAAEKGHLSVIQVLNKVVDNEGKPVVDMNLGRKQLIRRGKETPMEIAAKNGHASVLKELMDSGVKVRESDSFKFALNAMFRQHFSIIKLLVEEDKSLLNRPDDHGRPLTYLAVLNDKLDSLKMLAGLGADLDQPNKEGITPAFYAAQSDKRESLKLLATLGANLYKENDEKKSLISIVIEKKWDDVIQVLVTNAVEKGEVENLKILAGYKVNLNLEDPYGRTPVMLAVETGHIGIVKVLAEQKSVDFSKTDRLGRTLAFLAAQNGQEEVLGELAKQKLIDLDKPDKYGRTPAFIAAEKGNIEVLKLLATFGVDLNKADETGLTPAVIAAQNGNTEVIKFFCELAEQKENPRVNLNIAGGPLGCNPVTAALLWGHTSIYEALVENKAVNIEMPDKNNRTPLSIAVQNQHWEMVMHILLGVKSCPENIEISKLDKNHLKEVFIKWLEKQDIEKQKDILYDLFSKNNGLADVLIKPPTQSSSNSVFFKPTEDPIVADIIAKFRVPLFQLLEEPEKKAVVGVYIQKKLGRLRSPNLTPDRILEILANRSNDFIIEDCLFNEKRMDHIKNIIQLGIEDLNPVVRLNAERANSDFKNILSLAEAYPNIITPMTIFTLAGRKEKFIVDDCLADEKVMNSVKGVISKVIPTLLTGSKDYLEYAKEVEKDFENSKTLEQACISIGKMNKT